MEQISFRNTDITGGFWKKRTDINSTVSVWNVMKRFKETGRFDALSCNWKEGESNEPHIFWDSDVAKWIESVAYILEKNNLPELENFTDEIISDIAENQLEDGYYNCCYITKHLEKRWTDRTDHELYCLGHYIEAAVAYSKATGKDMLLDVVEKYLAYVYDVFVVKKEASFVTPGHEEIELALIKLYDHTGNEKYLEMCSFFVDSRGCNDEPEYNGVAHKYSQSHLPVRQQFTAEGHSVRACYLYCAMADLARKTEDNELINACEKIFHDIITSKMYITGGIGSAGRGEAFTVPYDLPNLTAYSESCAALSLAWFAQRMLLIDADSRYSDTIERILYNNGLSSVSLDGKSFFYVNPLEIRTELLERNTSQENTHEWLPITERKEVFDCSCCPPNITRFIASVADFLYGVDGDTVYVHQYMNSVSEFNNYKISQTTDYPNDGTIKIHCENISSIAIRIPSWCTQFGILCNDEVITPAIEKGYAYIELDGSENEIILSLDMTPKFVYPNPKVRDCAGKVAVMRGPVVYCAEKVDNDFNLMSAVVDTSVIPECEYSDTFGTFVVNAECSIPCESDSLYSFAKPEYKKGKIRMIPYYGFANRGETDMEVYLLFK